jgi:hypothetical protein
VTFNGQPVGKSKEIQGGLNLKLCEFVNLTPGKQCTLYRGGDKSCLCYTGLINRLHSLTAVVTAVKLVRCVC